jgi:hypothetical protein
VFRWARCPDGEGGEKRVQLRARTLYTVTLNRRGGVQVEVEHEYVRASEETKAVWKWSAIPRTIRDQAATTAETQKFLKNKIKIVSWKDHSWMRGYAPKREARRMLKMECMVQMRIVASGRRVLSRRGVVESCRDT